MTSRCARRLIDMAGKRPLFRGHITLLRRSLASASERNSCGSLRPRLSGEVSAFASVTHQVESTRSRSGEQSRVRWNVARRTCRECDAGCTLAVGPRVSMARGLLCDVA